MIFDRRRYWIPFLLVSFLAGCGGDKADNAKKEGETKVMDREEGPPKKKDKPPLKKDGESKPEEDKPPENGPVKRVNCTTLAEEFRDDADKVKQAYHGKTLLVTGDLEEIGLTALGDAYLMLAGQQVPVARQVEFVMGEREPWSKAVPGQTVDIKARCEILGGELRFKDGTVMEAKGPGRLTVTATELASGFGKDSKEAADKYGDHYVDVSGEAARIETAAGKDLVKFTFKTPGKVLVSCEFTGQTIAPLRKIKQGDAVKVFGRVIGYNAAQGVELKDCLLYAKP